MSKDLIDEVVEQREVVKRISEELDEAKARLNNLEALLIEQWLEDGTSSVKRNGKTVFLTRNLLVSRRKEVDADRLSQILSESGYGDLVKPTVNASSLAALVREHSEIDENTLERVYSLPSELVECLNTFEQHRVSVRKG